MSNAKGVEFRFDAVPELTKQEIKVPVNAFWNNDLTRLANETYSLTGQVDNDYYGPEAQELATAWDAEHKSTFTPEELNDGTYDRARWEAVYKDRERSIFTLVQRLLDDIAQLKSRVDFIQNGGTVA